jgi:hypothetical protein
LIIDDILKVIYAPHKAFKGIVSNPKYLGAFIILLLFVGLEIGYQYSQFSKTYTELTAPNIDQLQTFNNATTKTSDNTLAWRSSSNVLLTNNFNDPFNYSIYVAGFGLPPTDPNAYYSLFGNFSLQMASNNTNSLNSSLDIVTALRSINETLAAQKATPLSSLTVDCSPSAFQNLSLTLKQVTPQSVPQNATLTLYSSGGVSDLYQYNLTPLLSNQTTNEWTNLTIPLGPNAANWTSKGNPTWSNITSLRLDFAYPSSSNITIRVGALFFHGEYQTPTQYNSTGLLLQFLQLFSLQFIFAWFILTGIIYLVCRLQKNPMLWKLLFTAIGYAMVIMVIRALVNLGATLALPIVYYPYDLSLGARFDPFGALYYPSDALGTLPAMSHTIFNSIDSATIAFRDIVSGMFIVSYVWLGAVIAFAIGELKPEFSSIKKIALSAGSIAIVVLLLIFLVGSI